MRQKIWYILLLWVLLSVTSIYGVADVADFYVAVDGDGRIVVVWEQDVPENTGTVAYTLLDPAGNIIPGQTDITLTDLSKGEAILDGSEGHRFVAAPPKISEPVGGEISPISLIAILPWMALIGAAIALSYTITRKKPLIH